MKSNNARHWKKLLRSVCLARIHVLQFKAFKPLITYLHDNNIGELVLPYGKQKLIATLSILSGCEQAGKMLLSDADHPELRTFILDLFNRTGPIAEVDQLYQQLCDASDLYREVSHSKLYHSVRGLQVWNPLFDNVCPGLFIGYAESISTVNTCRDLDITLLSWWMERESMLEEMLSGYLYTGIDSIELHGDKLMKKTMFQDTFYYRGTGRDNPPAT